MSIIWYLFAPLFSMIFFCFVLPVLTKLVIAMIMGYRDKLSLLGVFFINLITIPLLALMSYISFYFISPIFIGFFSYEFIDMYRLLSIIILNIVFMLIEWRLLMYVLEKRKYKMLIMAIIMDISSFVISYISSLVWLYIQYNDMGFNNIIPSMPITSAFLHLY